MKEILLKVARFSRTTECKVCTFNRNITNEFANYTYCYFAYKSQMYTLYKQVYCFNIAITVWRLLLSLRRMPTSYLYLKHVFLQHCRILIFIHLIYVLVFIRSPLLGIIARSKPVRYYRTEKKPNHNIF